MKFLTLTFALVSTAVAVAGGVNTIPTNPIPDAGTSALLLGIGIAALGAFRRFRR